MIVITEIAVRFTSQIWDTPIHRGYSAKSCVTQLFFFDKSVYMAFRQEKKTDE